MYHAPFMYPYSHIANGPMFNYGIPPVPTPNAHANGFRYPNGAGHSFIRDYGPNPFVININEVTKQNRTFRTALWTGKHLQVTLMSLNPGEDIGLEMHPDVDQFLRVEQGQGIVQMGNSRNNLSFQRKVFDDSAIVIPAGKWHNLTNTGNVPLKLYSIYAPPNHPFGTVHTTKAEAMAAEEHHNHNQNRQFYNRTPDEWLSPQYFW
jgi:mannose-6-phosphate isomerase-like protein (cupin superfamily)